MTDWGKLKVANLKDELKARGIPLTGLKLKQQFIERLEELDRDVHGAVGATGNEEATEITAQEATESPSQVKHEELGAIDDAPKTQSPPAASQELIDAAEAERGPSATSAGAELPELIDSYSSAPKPTPSQPLGNLLKDHQKTAVIDPPTYDGGTAAVDDPSLKQSETSQPPKTFTPSITTTPIPTEELIEDSKKRKRRSVTPPPSAEDVALKKAKARYGSPIVTKHESSALEYVQEATDAAEALRDPDGLRHDILSNNKNVEARDFTAIDNAPDIPSLSANEPTGNLHAPARSPSSEKTKSESPALAEQNRAVTPALHPATRSLYMRNFKRPLHIPTLRKHIEELTQSPSSSSSDHAIACFYLDSIRTHAFVSFTSISAAARVRTSMHDIIFPDEATRVPIWIDFIPDNRLQSWIDEENANGGDKNRKWEVVYNVSHDGVEAVHQELGAAGASTKENSLQQQASASKARSQVIPTAPGVHPERVAMVPREERSGYYSSSQLDNRPTATSNPYNGRGFKELDELFSSTTAKPKLYYKSVPIIVTDSRLNMIKDLRLDHGEMGKSGDAGMIRYTFESYKGGEEWVEKGPEFGYGRKGVERLAGRGGRGGGGFRGGRRFEGGRGVESWRGRN